MNRNPMQRAKDKEPVALALITSFGPPLLGGLFALARQIHHTIEACDANERDCAELDQHVYEVMHSLEYIQSDAPYYEHLEQPLLSLQVCLEECLVLVDDFSRASAVGQFFLSHRYKRKFKKVNDQLDKCKNRLLFIMQMYELPGKHRRSQLTTTTLLHLDGHHRHKHVDRSEHRPTTPLVQHHVRQSPVINHHHQHQSRASDQLRTPNSPRLSSLPRSVGRGVHHH